MIIKDLKELNGVKNKHWTIQCNDVFLYVDSIMANREIYTAYKNTVDNVEEIVEDLEKFGFKVTLYEPIITEIYEGEHRVMHYNSCSGRVRISSPHIFELWIELHEDINEVLEEIKKDSRYKIFKK